MEKLAGKIYWVNTDFSQSEIPAILPHTVYRTCEILKCRIRDTFPPHPHHSAIKPYLDYLKTQLHL